MLGEGPTSDDDLTAVETPVVRFGLTISRSLDGYFSRFSPSLRGDGPQMKSIAKTHSSQCVLVMFVPYKTELGGEKLTTKKALQSLFCVLDKMTQRTSSRMGGKIGLTDENVATATASAW